MVSKKNRNTNNKVEEIDGGAVEELGAPEVKSLARYHAETASKPAFFFAGVLAGSNGLVKKSPQVRLGDSGFCKDLELIGKAQLSVKHRNSNPVA